MVIARQEEALKYEKGYIFKQLTAKGTELPEGAKLQVYVSTGLKEIEVPDVIEKTEKDAIKALVEAGAYDNEKGFGFSNRSGSW